MASPKKTILLTGATGYIGGAVLDNLLNHRDAQSFEIVAIVRDPSKAKKLEALGVRAIVGSHNDASVIEPLVVNSDVVITAANVDDKEAANVILRGIRRRYEESGVAPILIHTSGTSVLSDEAFGLQSTDVIYDDTDVALLKTIPSNNPHRPVDLLVLGADEEGYVRTYLVIPPTIYGRRKGRLVEQGISNPMSIQIPRLIKAGVARGVPVRVGTGVNFWPNVHIDELAELYALIFDAVVSASPPSHGWEGIYFPVSGEHQLIDVYNAVGKALVAAGKASSEEPTELTDDEIEKLVGKNGKRALKYSFGSNSRARATRGRALGWKPVKGTQDLLASIPDEVQAALQT